MRRALADLEVKIAAEIPNAYSVDDERPRPLGLRMFSRGRADRGCFSISKAAKGDNGMTLKIESAAFAPGGEIPVRYTGEGEDVSPPLSWSGVPVNTKSLVLIVDDPDAPDPAAPKMVWVHWLLYNIPPSVTGLSEGVKSLPAGTGEGLNDWKRTGYGGPLPPIGRHRYFFKLHALDETLKLAGTPTKADLVKAMQGHILAEATLIGTYQARKK
jgi:Raf kinase inhibitor-like YbhB/YbcL family protein